MSKQSDAKEAQQYNEKPIPHVCSNCLNYRSVVTTNKGIFGGSYQTEKNRRCAIGGFAVKKTASCDAFNMDTSK